MIRVARYGLALCLIAGCGGEDAVRPPPPPPKPIVAAADAGPTAPADPLGPRPALGAPSPFTPPVPVAYKRPNGMAVWLLERHSLPIVSMQIVVPVGAAQDPEAKGGLAYITANMLDEGAGKRGPLELARDLDRLGATLSTHAYADYSAVQLTVLKKNLSAAAPILGDVVAKPQMAPIEWKRVHDLWQNGLKARQSEPGEVANVVIAKRAYPAGHPYSHPTEGTIPSAAKISLEDVKAFYGASFRPDRATCIVVGDLTRAELDPLLDQALADWKTPAAQTAAKPADPVKKAEPAGRRVVIVDRADAPQSVIAVARPGVAASDEDAPIASRVNTIIGGSFTSRLNQDLREEHGWSYGAKSRFSFTKMRSLFVAQAAVHTEHTGDALKAMLADLSTYAKEGPTDEETEKSRLLARADLVETFETVDAAARRLGRSAGIGLLPEHEANASKVMNRADKATLKKLAASYIDPNEALIVIVGPRKEIEPQLKKIGIEKLEASGPEGQTL